MIICSTKRMLNAMLKKWICLICASCLCLLLTTAVVDAAEKPSILKLALNEGTKSARYIHGSRPWADAVEQASNGSIKVSVFPSGSLVSAKQMYNATVNGLTDISCISTGHYPGQFPLTNSLSFPGNGISNPRMASEIITEMYAKYPQMQKEFKAVKVLFFFGFAPITIASVEKPIRSWDDLNGLRLRVNHKSSANYLKTAGVSPAFISPADIFLSLQKGVIDGSVMGWPGHQAYGTTKLAQYFTEVPSVPGPFFAYIMNKNKFKKLSADQQTALMSVSGKAGARIMSNSGFKEIEVATKDIRDNPKQRIIQLSEKEEIVWAEKAINEQKKLIKKMETKGFPIQQFLQDVKSLVKAKKKSS